VEDLFSPCSSIVRHSQLQATEPTPRTGRVTNSHINTRALAPVVDPRIRFSFYVFAILHNVLSGEPAYRRGEHVSCCSLLL
jgi:hypothetical protein